MFDNIGGKIKTLAKVVCWIGIITCSITGLVLMSTDEHLILYGLLTVVVGSLLSWVGSFVLYGFGQLVENSDTLIQQNKVNNTKSSEVFDNTPKIKQVNDSHTESKHKWRCVSCGEMISENPCPFCKNESQHNESSTAPFWCGNCGNDGPYEGNCPNCGSSIKMFNVNNK